jgi:hypothetical protein
MTSLLTTNLRVAMMALGLGTAALATAGCAADGSTDDEIGWDDSDDGLDDADDTDGPSDLAEQVDDSGLPDPTFICHPDEIDGSVVRLSLENGAMKACGAVWSNVAPCIVHLNVQGPPGSRGPASPHDATGLSGRLAVTRLKWVHLC